MGFTINWSSPLVAPIITATAAFLGVLVASAFVPAIRSFIARRRAARYLAIRVVCILDKYIDDCALVCGDSGEEDHHGVTHGVYKAPPPPTYPDEVDWQSIDYALMYELLSLPAAAEKASNAVRIVGDYSDPPDYTEYFEARCREYGNLAVRAHELASKVRKSYNVPALATANWNPVDYAKEHLAKLDAVQEKRAAAYRADEDDFLIEPAPPAKT